ncbi:unnamed protein product [Closterium sp. Yama58-4]|nr:unnamed protein product [Closterium sp. Yama58-4]
MESWKCVREVSFPSSRMNEYRHLLLSDFSDAAPTLPPEELMAMQQDEAGRQRRPGAHGLGFLIVSQVHCSSAMADRLNSMSVGDSVQLACRDSLLPFLQQEARAAGGGGSAGGGGGGAGSEGGELKLLEVEESMLAELLSDGLVIKGTPEEGDEAVLCTRSSTFALKLVTTTNLLLLVPPHENSPGKNT